MTIEHHPSRKHKKKIHIFRFIILLNFLRHQKMFGPFLGPHQFGNPGLNLLEQAVMYTSSTGIYLTLNSNALLLCTIFLVIYIVTSTRIYKLSEGKRRHNFRSKDEKSSITVQRVVVYGRHSSRS
uniref:Uncharacterized protein n=1 Tax=Cacopsylla melanoneura TaxID=428564 RepID=A0A8D9E7N9_9HEMI